MLQKYSQGGAMLSKMDKSSRLKILLRQLSKELKLIDLIYVNVLNGFSKLITIKQVIVVQINSLQNSRYKWKSKNIQRGIRTTS